jgi:mannose-6-phosphate isomerase-like protein (cupin superfamily)
MATTEKGASEISDSTSSCCNRRHLFRMLTCTMAGTAILTKLGLAQEREKQSWDGPRTLLLEPGKSRTGTIGGSQIDFKLTASQTWGSCGSTEIVLSPGFMGAPPHFHKHFDEVVRVLEGTLTIMVGETVHEVPAGGWHLRPRGQVHAFWNSSKVPVKAIEIYLPGGHEEYLQELAALFADGKRPSREVLTALGETNDVHWDFEKLPGIAEKYKVKL